MCFLKKGSKELSSVLTAAAANAPKSKLTPESKRRMRAKSTLLDYGDSDEELVTRTTGYAADLVRQRNASMRSAREAKKKAEAQSRPDR